MSDTIIIGFSTGRSSLIAAIIRAAERTPYSHVYLRFWSGSIQRWLIYHADNSDIHFNNIETFTANSLIIDEYTIPVSQEEKCAALQLCVDRVGRPYGKLQVVGMGLVRLVKAWFNVKVRNPLSDGERTQVCSEIAGRVIKILGGPIDVSMLEHEGPRYIHSVVEQMVASGRAQKRT